MTKKKDSAEKALKFCLRLCLCHGGRLGMALANPIRRDRFEHGEMTQKRLAELIGVCRQTVNAIERNKHAPSLEVAFKIARVFGVPI